jgi:transcriptional regulator with XRE-family HTH domain
MSRNLNQILADLPANRRARIDGRYREMKAEIESLRELRRVAGKAQADVASALKIKQPSVSKIEQQTDMYLSTLRSYVQAIGGELDLVVRLPKRPAPAAAAFERRLQTGPWIAGAAADKSRCGKTNSENPLKADAVRDE